MALNYSPFKMEVGDGEFVSTRVFSPSLKYKILVSSWESSENLIDSITIVVTSWRILPDSAWFVRIFLNRAFLLSAKDVVNARSISLESLRGVERKMPL